MQVSGARSRGLTRRAASRWRPLWPSERRPIRHHRSGHKRATRRVDYWVLRRSQSVFRTFPRQSVRVLGHQTDLLFRAGARFLVARHPGRVPGARRPSSVSGRGDAQATSRTVGCSRRMLGSERPARAGRPKKILARPPARGAGGLDRAAAFAFLLERCSAVLRAGRWPSTITWRSRWPRSTWKARRAPLVHRPPEAESRHGYRGVRLDFQAHASRPPDRHPLAMALWSRKRSSPVIRREVLPGRKIPPSSM